MQPDLQEGLKSRALERGRVPQEQIAGMGVMQPRCILRNSFASIVEVFQREEARRAESEDASSASQICLKRLKKPSDRDSETSMSLITNGLFSRSESTPIFMCGYSSRSANSDTRYLSNSDSNIVKYLRLNEIKRNYWNIGIWPYRDPHLIKLSAGFLITA